MIDPKYRDWMQGNNHPLNPEAALNANHKIESKWDNEYLTIRRTIERNKKEASEEAERRRLAQEAKDFEVLQAYLDHKRTRKIAARQRRQRKKEVQKMERDWVEQKMAANAAWVRQSAQATLDAEMAQEKARLQRVRERQAKFDATWAVRRAKLLEGTVHYKDKEQDSLPAQHDNTALTRDYPGEAEWRTKHTHSTQFRPAPYWHEKVFEKTAPMLSRGVGSLTPSPSPLVRLRLASKTPQPWAPEDWNKPPLEPWRVAKAGTRLHTATPSWGDNAPALQKVVKIGNELSKPDKEEDT